MTKNGRELILPATAGSVSLSPYFGAFPVPMAAPVAAEDRPWHRHTLLTTEEAVQYLREIHNYPISVGTLDKWRSKGTRGKDPESTIPAFIKRGYRVFYAIEELDRWITDVTSAPRHNTSQR